MAFSSSMMLADLDYIAPSQACVKPMLMKMDNKKKGTAAGAPHEEGGGLALDGSLAPTKEEVIKISLQDCLACSGCVTTAETMLVTQQSKDELMSVMAGASPPALAVSVSDQSAASIAVQLGMSTAQAFRVISGFLRSYLNATLVCDMRFAQDVSLHESCLEFEKVMRCGGSGAEGTPALPVIVSSCPGWICYCEKTHPSLIPHLSAVRSPQAILGNFLKSYVGPKLNIAPERVYHVSIQPCFDKKLEAARGDFAASPPEQVDTAEAADEEPVDAVRETDCVLSSAELLEWMKAVDPALGWDAPLDNTPHATRPPLNPPTCEAGCHEGSGGYHLHVLQHTVQRLWGASVRLEDFVYKQKRNANHKEITYTHPVDPAKVLRVCVAYGFQHIQNIVRGMKRGTCSYHYIELMACPDGCLNGGGQARATSTAAHRELLDAVHTSFKEHSHTVALSYEGGGQEGVESPNVKTRRVDREAMLSEVLTKAEVYGQWVGQAGPGSARAKELLHTVYHDRQKDMDEANRTIQSLKW